MASLVAAAAAGTTAVFLLRAAVRDGRARSMDAAVRRWFGEHHGRFASAVAAAGSAAGKAEVTIAASFALGAWVAARRGVRPAVPLALSALAAWVAQRVGKHVFDRQRPPRARREGKTEPSFPSGHATASAALGLTTVYVLARQGLASPRATVPAALAYCALNGAAKLIAERHWVSDLAAGYAAGLAVAAGCAALHDGLTAGRRPRPVTSKR